MNKTINNTQNKYDIKQQTTSAELQARRLVWDMHIHDVVGLKIIAGTQPFFESGQWNRTAQDQTEQNNRITNMI